MRSSSLSLSGRPLVLGLTASFILAAAATAQDPEPRVEQDRENCICFDEAPGEGVFGSYFTGNRARIGVLLGDDVEVDGRAGVEVEDVTAGGPAEDAGLEAGDIITALDGRALGDEPADGLVDAMGDVEPGDTVTVTYYRDGDRRTAEVATESGFAMSFVRGGDRDFDLRVAPRVMDLGRLREGATGLRVMTPGALVRRAWPGDLELVELNPGLGEYFGTAEGVLVVEVGEDSGLGLRAGDVILAIDGRDVRDAAHVRAIIDSYREDETITFRVVRQDRTLEVEGTIDD